MAKTENGDGATVTLEEQREEIMPAKTLALARDQELALNLQRQEALAASRATHISSPSGRDVEAATVNFTGGDADDGEEFDFASLILQDIAGVDQERQDREFAQQEMKRLKVDLDRRIHDQKFAKEIMNIPDGDGSKHGDYFKKPYTSSSVVKAAPFSFASIGDESFPVYCKGLLNEEMTGDTRATVGGIGLAICDSANNLIWEVNKVLGAAESKSSELDDFKVFFNNETCACAICYEDIPVEKMLSIDGCFHRFCFSCMKQHAEVKLLQGQSATCPTDGCKSEIQLEFCMKVLHPNLVALLLQRKKEDSISAANRVYCPYPNCSHLMVKEEVLEYTEQVLVGADRYGATKCFKCGGLFCMRCKVPWHFNISCDDYRTSDEYKNMGEGMLKSLAERQLWRECLNCSNMVELVFGCFHITCRCGFQFCYTCGSEWVKKKATCSCPIWEERYIIG